MSEAPISGRAQDNIRSLQIHGEVIRRFLEVRREDRTFWCEVPTCRASAGHQEELGCCCGFEARSASRAGTGLGTAGTTQRPPSDAPLRGRTSAGSEGCRSEPVARFDPLKQPQCQSGRQPERKSRRRVIVFGRPLGQLAAIERWIDERLITRRLTIRFAGEHFGRTLEQWPIRWFIAGRTVAR